MTLNTIFYLEPILSYLGYTLFKKNTLNLHYNFGFCFFACSVNMVVYFLVMIYYKLAKKKKEEDDLVNKLLFNNNNEIDGNNNPTMVISTIKF